MNYVMKVYRYFFPRTTSSILGQLDGVVANLQDHAKASSEASAAHNDKAAYHAVQAEVHAKEYGRATRVANNLSNLIA